MEPMIRLGRYGWNTSKEGSLRRKKKKKKKKKKSKVEEIQLANLASLGRLASNKATTIATIQNVFFFTKDCTDIR